MHPIAHKLFKRDGRALGARIDARYGADRKRCSRCGWRYKQDDRLLPVCGSCYDLIVGKLRKRILDKIGW